MIRKQDYEDSLVWIREFRVQNKDLRERIVELRLQLRAVLAEPFDEDRRRIILHEEIADVLGDMQAILDGED